MEWMKDDGGRANAGYKGIAGDCVCRAIAIATGKPYATVYATLNVLGKSERIGKRKSRRSSSRNGVYRKTIRAYLSTLGWTFHPTMGIGTGCKVHLRDGELPGGRLIVNLSKHLCAVIDGVIHDLSDPSRNGTRCVYGYWTKDENPL